MSELREKILAARRGSELLHHEAWLEHDDCDTLLRALDVMEAVEEADKGHNGAIEHWLDDTGNVHCCDDFQRMGIDQMRALLGKIVALKNALNKEKSGE